MLFHACQANLILTAVTEVIKGSGTDTTPAAYFAALMTALESAGSQGPEDVLSVRSDTPPEGQQATLTHASSTITALQIFYLLSLDLPFVRLAVLRSKFAPAAKLFLSAIQVCAHAHIQALSLPVVCLTLSCHPCSARSRP